MECHYFLSTVGSSGRASFLEQSIKDLGQVIRLYGYPRALCSEIFKEVYEVAKKGHVKTDVLHNGLDNSVEGLVFPDLGTGVINTPIYELRYDIYSLFENKNLSLCHTHLKGATEAFYKAKKIHDDLEKVYVDATDYNALNRLADDTIHLLFDGKTINQKPRIRDRFFGATTINGPTDYIDNITQGIKRYFIKGRAGTGKSTFLKKLASAAVDNGFSVTRYHCAFDPYSLDMVVIEELKLCFFDSTSPHEYFPSRKDDEILDFYAHAVAPGTDEKYWEEISRLNLAYKQAIEDAVLCVQDANRYVLAAENECLEKVERKFVDLVIKNIMLSVFP